VSNTGLQPFILEPISVRKVWGIDGVGERWEISEMDDAVCRIAGGPFNGASFRDLIRRDPDGILGKRIAKENGGRLPLLLKTIMAAEALSVQVHPDDVYARSSGDAERGKTEAWIVLDAAPGAKLIVGTRGNPDRRSFRAALEATGAKAGQAMLESLRPERNLSAGEVGAVFRRCPLGAMLNVIPVRKGDCVYLAPGTLHAICGGLTLYEIQQACDVTYRVYDWHRMGDDGKPRELHVDKAMDVLDFSSVPAVTNISDASDGDVLADSPCFTLELVAFAGEKVIPSAPGRDDAFMIVTAYDSSLDVCRGGARIALGPGRSAFVPAFAAEGVVLRSPGRSRALMARPVSSAAARD